MVSIHKNVRALGIRLYVSRTWEGKFSGEEGLS